MPLRRAGSRVINTDAIVSIRELGSHPDLRLHFVMNNGNEFDVLGDDLEEWTSKNPKPIIPAQPGFRRISAHRSSLDQAWQFMEFDIIGWVISYDGEYVSPLTIDGDEGYNAVSNTSFAAVVDPQGKCSVPGDAYFDTVDEWKAWIESRNAEHLRRRAERVADE